MAREFTQRGRKRFGESLPRHKGIGLEFLTLGMRPSPPKRYQDRTHQILSDVLMMDVPILVEPNRRVLDQRNLFRNLFGHHDPIPPDSDHVGNWHAALT